MAAINDLISQIQDETLRNRIQEEVSKMAKQKKFGLVFEEHMPESTPLYDMPIKRGCNVMRRDSKDDKAIYVVLKVEGDTAVCVKPEQKDEAVTFELKDIVRVAEFGESIYPYLKPLDSVCNAPDSDLWHTLIEADNYHALQLLEYLYAGKVDCIYIDPPYNTGAKDWKYNNDYVDGADAYRHSKWLSFMQRRLKLAKKLLNPQNSVMMITIDDIELCHLKILLDELFPECGMQIVDMVINPKGKAKVGRLSQVDEYLILVYMGAATTIAEQSYEDGEEIRWPYLRRSDIESARGTTKGGTQQFYPIYVDKKTEKIVAIGASLTPEQSLDCAPLIEGTVAVFPIREDGKEMNWGLTGESLQYAIDNGCVRVSKSKNKNQAYNFSYVTMPSIKKALTGEYIVAGEREDGTKVILLPNGTEHQKPTAWKETYYDANAYGTKLIGRFLNEKRFSFPKSIYSVYDALTIYLRSKKEALVLDFFAGSGTTLHAVNLMNASDNGNRRCILVTNNEVSAQEAEMLAFQGYKPGDKEWEKLGIARYVTWPRTVCSIEGHDVSGIELTGNYGCEQEQYIEIDGEVTEPASGKKIRGKVYKKAKKQAYPELASIKMADGFKANAAFFKLGFLDPTAVSLGMRFSEMLPTLWLKTGAKGKCPELSGEQIPDMLILPENKFAVLINENKFANFAEKLTEHPEIQTVFLATDYEVNYQSMVKNLNVANAYQLYRDYLDHFRVNRGRN